MKLSEAIEKVNGLRFLIENLETISASGRRTLYNFPFMTKKEDIIASFNDTAEMCELFSMQENKKTISLIQMKLMQIKDINRTIEYVSNNNVKDDIELFELKHFAILSEAIRDYVAQINIKSVNLPELKQLIQILDPEGKQIPSFHIYDAYSQELAECRKEYKQIKDSGNDDKAEEIRFKASQIEDSIRKQLSEKIRPFAKDLTKALDAVSKIDILLAKALLIRRYKLIKPNISHEKTVLKEMFNPQIADHLTKEKKVFQPIDIEIERETSLIVGANMAGKSVLLKTVALVQYLAQFGFYVPCSSASIVPVDAVYISLGDGQNEMKGLSSFGAEMLQLDQIIKEIEKGKDILVLLDELARTTNPVEGKAIVSSMIELLKQNKVLSLITSHYSGIKAKCNKLRVKGFREDKLIGKLNAENINDYMDYSLQKDLSEEVPFEAIRIAEILGISNRLLQSAKKFLEN